MQSRMNPMLRTIILVGVFAVAGCAQKERHESEPTAAPAVWESVDKSFDGCEGG
ncbi:MAG: hypothetical protein HUU21_21350 [Polyangiaceae bacterium]|nr:hypothetical protein [Polyangiaceae bacterium]